MPTYSLHPLRINLVWLALVLATGATWWLGETGAAGRQAMMALLTIAGIKCALVAWEFMAFKDANWLWRGLLLGWLLLVTTLIALKF